MHPIIVLVLLAIFSFFFIRDEMRQEDRLEKIASAAPEVQVRFTSIAHQVESWKIPGPAKEHLLRQIYRREYADQLLSLKAGEPCPAKTFWSYYDESGRWVYSYTIDSKCTVHYTENAQYKIPSAKS